MFAPIRNGFVGIATPFYTTKEQGVRYLQSTNIHDGSIGDETCIYITKDFHQAHIKNELKETDILMVQSGHSGECAVVGKKYAGCNCHALIIMSSLGLSDSRFVCDYLNGVGKAKTKILLTGNTVKHILASDVKDIRIMVPPIASQKRISDFMSLLTQRIQVQNKIIEELI
ncbi:MAG: restriction endonuclease subunit S, partial [Bacilli bacterium]|nr:restriction endonuclease subunit S [Bacilli bacterium]